MLEKLVEVATTRRPLSPQSFGQMACVRGVDGVRLTVLSPEGSRSWHQGGAEGLFFPLQLAATQIFKVLQCVYGFVLLISHQPNTCGE